MELSRIAVSDPMTRGSTTSKAKISGAPREDQRIEDTTFKQENLPRHGEDQLIECVGRPIQPTLQGATRRNLLVVLYVVARPGSGRPRGAGELQGLDFTVCRALQQRHPCLFVILDLRGGSSCRNLGATCS
jgi:hypothetical protein